MKRLNATTLGILVFVIALMPLNEAQTVERGSVESNIRRSTYTYKTVGELEIKADVYRPDDDELRPVVMWIHGGALIMGGRQIRSDALKKLLLEAGYVIVSIDYRLAPETKLPQIIEDVQDAYSWIRRTGAQLFKGKSANMVVVGGSAGGYLTLTSGFRLEPRPAALISLFGYGELVGEWYSRPYEPYRKELISKADAYAVLENTPIANGRTGKNRGQFYMYCRQNGLWPLLVGGFDPDSNPEAFEPYSALYNVDKDYPPTFLIHGDKDLDVPYEQSVMMSQELAKNDVDHSFITIKNGGHGSRFGNANPKDVDRAFRDSVAFINRFTGNQTHD